MEPDRWRRIEDLFFSALESTEASRSSLLAAARAADPEIASEAEAMLAAHLAGQEGETGGVEGFLLGPHPGEPAIALARAGRRVGAYRLGERLGQGGMGEVFLAERVDGGFEQRVAVKLLRSGLEGPEGVARFRAERAILARLEHSNIARLLDGGLTPEGLPFLAMEAVRGEPITRFCDARRLPIEARLRLFVDVCRAVHYAHRSLVVHRDLKPSNLLVTGDGEVKLLDFGIAKLMEESEGGEPATRTGLLLLTPEYASPEQVRGEAVTTATDVYALGLLLSEILTGRRAQPVSDSSPLGIARAVCDEAPLKPSLAVLAGPPGEAAERVERAEARGFATPERLARRLHGDLDTLVASAVHKDPARRCASAERLAADLELHLAGRPIEARADSLGYRAGKLLRRHRLAAAASAAAVLALVLGLLFAVSGLLRARRAEAAAHRDAETSRQVSNLLVGIFEINDPSESRGETVTARELLDRGAERVRTQLAGQPEVQANLFRTMGEAYSQLGLYRRAAEQYERDLAVRERLRGTGDVESKDRRSGREVAISLTRLSTEKSKSGAYQQALELGERALALHAKSPVEADLEMARAFGATGVAHSNLGHLRAARQLLEKAVALVERRPSPDDRELASLLSDLAVVHWRMNDLDGARRLFERSLALFERRYGPRHLTVANLLNNLAMVDDTAGRFASGRARHERALAIRRAVLTPDHPDITESLNNLGNTLISLGELEEARTMLEEALAIRERVLGPDHPFVATTLCNLGIVRARLGDPLAARPLLERSVDIYGRSVGVEHNDVGAPLQILAQVYRNTGNLPAADRASARLVALREKHQTTSPPSFLQQALVVRARVLRSMGRDQEAEAVEKRAEARSGGVG